MGKSTGFADANQKCNKYDQPNGSNLRRAPGSKEWQTTTFVYDDGGVSIEVPNVYAWVCLIDGEASFTSDTTDELIETVRDLVTPAKRARERSMPTEYIVCVA